MSKVGLVLGGGGVTGAAYQFGGLLALEMATGWDSSDADVVVGTSGGAVAASLVRGHGLSVAALVGDAEGPHDFTKRLSSYLYRRSAPRRLGAWVRHGLIGGIRRPGVKFVLGGPAPFTAGGIADWVSHDLGNYDHAWPERPTVIVAYDLAAGHRVAFGTEDAPYATIPDAVAASCAVPLIYQPHEIDGRLYVDGGVASGTHADLVLGASEPLDLMIVIAPMAAEDRPGRRFYEGVFDRAGRQALEEELALVRAQWPDTEILVFVPDADTLKLLRPNPLSPQASVPGFLASLRSFRAELASPAVWPVLERHLAQRVR